MLMSSQIVILCLVCVLSSLAVLVVLFFAIRALIRYNARMKAEKSQAAQEMDRMNIEDL